jgi:hypothetical protein
VRHFGALLRMEEVKEAATLQEARRLEEGALCVGRRRLSSIVRVDAAKSPIKDVAMATGMAYDTIDRACTSLCPHADLLFG